MLMICNSFRLGEWRSKAPFPQFLYLVGVVSVHLSFCVTHGTLVKGTLKEKMRCLVSFPQVDFLNEEMLASFFVIKQVVFHLVGTPFLSHFLPKSWQKRHCPATPNISLLTLLVRATERLRWFPRSQQRISPVVISYAQCLFGNIVSNPFSGISNSNELETDSHINHSCPVLNRTFIFLRVVKIPAITEWKKSRPVVM